MYPCLVQPWMLNKTVHLKITNDEPNEYNEYETLLDCDLKANVQYKSEQKVLSDRSTVTISCTMCFPNDILPTGQRISNGTAVIDGEEYSILTGQRLLNPDGTVNYTEVGVI